MCPRSVNAFNEVISAVERTVAEWKILIRKQWKRKKKKKERESMRVLIN